MKKYKYGIFSILLLFIITIYCSNLSNNYIYAENNNTLDISAKSCLLIDYNSNTVMYENNASARLPIASMVKLMTLLLTYEAIDNNQLSLDTLITTTENASGMGGSQVFIDPFVEYKAEDLIKSVIMASANDASVALAEHISGSENQFVKLMNSRANQLGMNNTLYANCTGLPAPEQYSCATDCAIVLKELMKHSHYHKYSSLWMDTLTHPSGRQTELVNTNKLVRYYKGCDSGKTGSTSEAGYCLSTSAIKDDFRIIAIVIGSKTGQERFNDASKLLNFGFSNFKHQVILDSTNPFLNNINIPHAKNKNINIFAKESFCGIAQLNQPNEYKTDYVLFDVKAPLKEGETVGKVYISKNGQVIKEIDLIVTNSVDKMTTLDNLKQIASNW